MTIQNNEYKPRILWAMMLMLSHINKSINVKVEHNSHCKFQVWESFPSTPWSLIADAIF